MSFIAQLNTFENLSETGALGATEAAIEASETQAEVADGNTEQVVAEGEVLALDTGIDAAFDGVERIEELQDQAEATLADGGMTEQHAATVEIAHESIMARLGMGHRATRHSTSPVTTLESYASNQSRASATVMTVESLKESAKNIWAKIIAALKAAWNVVSNFVVGLTRNRALMEKHIKNLQAKVKAIPSGNKPKEATFKTGAAALRGDGKADVGTAKQILADAEKLLTLVLSNAGLLGAFEAGDGWVAKLNDGITKSVEGLGKSGDHEGAPAYGHLTNGRAVVLKKGEGEDALVSTSITEVFKKSDTIAAPSAADMAALLDGALKVLTQLRNIERGLSDVKKGVDLAIKSAEAAASGEAKIADDKEASKALAGKRKAVRAAVSAVNKLGASFPGAVFSAVKATADYVNAGVNNHKAPAAAAAK